MATIKRVTILLVLLALMVQVGCASDQKVDKQKQDPVASNELLTDALGQIEVGDLAKAETLLVRALEHDAYNGPAYNALGAVYYHQGRLYKAAWQFRHAAKLLPHEPEPLNNLGLVLERAGQFDEAVEQYEQAVDLQPNNPEVLGNYVRSRIRRGDNGEVMSNLLQELVLRETRDNWLQWARRQMAVFSGRDADT